MATEVLLTGPWASKARPQELSQASGTVTAACRSTALFVEALKKRI
jgi:hypothetical protein